MRISQKYIYLYFEIRIVNSFCVFLYLSYNIKLNNIYNYLLSLIYYSRNPVYCYEGNQSRISFIWKFIVTRPSWLLVTVAHTFLIIILALTSTLKFDPFIWNTFKAKDHMESKSQYFPFVGGLIHFHVEERCCITARWKNMSVKPFSMTG